MKYIDADLLRKEIEKRLKNIRDYMTGVGMRYKGPKYLKAQGKESAYDALLNFIDSLQQDETQVDRMLCSQIWWEERGWIMIPPDATIEGIDSLLKQVRKKLQQEQPKKSQKSCNDCPHCVDRKDQFGWHFKGCFGRPYNGKFIAEIDECPLQQEPIEKDEKIEALIACDIMEATVKRVNIDKQDKDKEEEAMLEKITYLRNLGLKAK